MREIALEQTCRENALRAGIGMIAAVKKASILLKDVIRMVTPVLFKHSPVCSYKEKHISNETNVWISHWDK